MLKKKEKKVKKNVIVIALKEGLLSAGKLISNKIAEIGS